MKSYIFDFDGTIIDSMSMWADMILDMLDEKGVSYPEDIINIVTPMSQDMWINYIAALDTEKLSYETVFNHVNDYSLYQYSSVIPTKSNVVKKLRELHSQGYSLSILTACAHELLDPCLKRLGLDTLFDNVWSCDDLGMPKSNPEIFKKVALLLGKSPEECVLFDDNIDALKTAKSAGFCVVGVYDKTSERYESDIRAFADGYVRDFDEIR